jgi:predicted anti-sigma-YlaC factor YlaD
VNAQLSHREAQRLFFAFADDELPSEDETRLTLHLEECGSCRAGWDRYARTVDRVRGVEREKAPAALATLIVRRARRRRTFGLRAIQLAHAQYRFPVEAAIPLLLGAAVAALLVLMAAP